MKINKFLITTLLLASSLLAMEEQDKSTHLNLKSERESSTKKVVMDTSWVRSDLFLSPGNQSSSSAIYDSVNNWIVIENSPKGSFLPIQNSVGDNRYYGKVMGIIPAVQQPFLTEISDRTRKGEEIKILEIGSAFGQMVWKMILSGAEVWANELSSKMMEEGGIFDQYITNCTPPTLQNKLHKITGSCFDILEKDSTLIESFDYVYVQAVEHFMHPTEHKLFMELVKKFLKPGGKAVLTANSPSIRGGLIPIFDFFKSQKEKNVPYPGYIKVKIEMDLIQDNPPLNENVLEVERPEDNRICTMHQLDSYEVRIPRGKGQHVVQESTSILFDIDTYKSAGQKQGLKFLKGFYTDLRGNVSKNIGKHDFVSVVLQKPTLQSSKNQRRKQERKKAAEKI